MCINQNLKYSIIHNFSKENKTLDYKFKKTCTGSVCQKLQNTKYKNYKVIKEHLNK